MVRTSTRGPAKTHPTPETKLPFWQMCPDQDRAS
jgi:hypothetical protein